MAVDFLAHKWTVRFILVVVIVLLTNNVELMARKVNFSSQRKQEIELMLKQLNKQAVKSFESDGEITDCIPIAKQPAFDHPLLKNHTIQMVPSSYPYEDYSEEDKEADDITLVWQLEEECPENTVPIKRITKEDLLRVDDIQNYGKKVTPSNISQTPHQIHHPTDIDTPKNYEDAIIYSNGVFRGARAKINIWEPRVRAIQEYSASHIRVLGGDFGHFNGVEAGWHVDPFFYAGDEKPRFFIYWKGVYPKAQGGYMDAGCYDLLCPGFVQIHKRIKPGALLKISTYNGQQYIINLLIWKDLETGNWFLKLGEKDVIGYWPGHLLPSLVDDANEIQWGGQVRMNLGQRGGQHTPTEMGSGHFPSEGFKKASYFRTVKVVDTDNAIKDPTKVQTFVSEPNCYDLKTGHGKTWGVYFYYGGPGLNPRCP